MDIYADWMTKSACDMREIMNVADINNVIVLAERNFTSKLHEGLIPYRVTGVDDAR